MMKILQKVDKKWFILAGVAVFFVLLVFVMTSDDVVELEPEEDEEEIIGCVDINEATQVELTEIIHIGQERAELIAENRPFTSVAELEEIEGIGPISMEDIKEQGLACIEG